MQATTYLQFTCCFFNRFNTGDLVRFSIALSLFQTKKISLIACSYNDSDLYQFC